MEETGRQRGGEQKQRRRELVRRGEEIERWEEVVGEERGRRNRRNRWKR